MKTIQTTIAILVLSIFAISCSKDADSQSDKVFDTQNPLAGYLETSGFTVLHAISIDAPNSLGTEFGLTFMPLRSGVINSFVVKTPGVNLDMRITIWDKAAATIVRTELINVPEKNSEVVVNIPPIALVKNKEYVFSWKTTSCFILRKPNNQDANYPVTIQDIKIISFKKTNIGANTPYTMPSTPVLQFYNGYSSFNFQPTE